MRTYVELEHAMDWLSGHSDEQQPEGFPNVIDRYDAIRILEWVMGGLIPRNLGNVPSNEDVDDERGA